MNKSSSVRQILSSTFSLGPFRLLLEKSWTSGLENTGLKGKLASTQTATVKDFICHTDKQTTGDTVKGFFIQQTESSVEVFNLSQYSKKTAARHRHAQTFLASVMKPSEKCVKSDFKPNNPPDSVLGEKQIDGRVSHPVQLRQSLMC